MVDRSSKSYFLGRFTAKGIIFLLILLVGKKSFPKKDEETESEN